MPRFLPDSDCMVAALSPRHTHHQRAVAELNRRFSAGEALVTAAPTLVQTYSVLTRLPSPLRLSPQEAWRTIEESFILTAETVVALDAEAHNRLLRESPGRDILGGQIYDAIIAACAEIAEVEVLLTFNERDFLRLVTPPTRVVVPA